MKDRPSYRFFKRFPSWIILPAFLLVFNLVFGFNGLYGQDAFEYLRYSRELHAYLSGGPLPGHFYWPILYPLSGALLSFFMPDIFALQLVSTLSFGLSLFFLQKILFKLFPGKRAGANVYLILFYGLSPFILRYASVAMAESLCILFLSAFFYHYLLFKEEADKKNFIILMGYAAAALNTRYASIVILAIPLVDAFSLYTRKFEPLRFILAILLSAVIFIPGLLLKLPLSKDISDQIIVPHWSFGNMFHHAFHSTDGYQSYMLPNIIYVFSVLVYPGFIFAGLPLLFFLRKPFILRPFILVNLLTILLYILFIAGFPFQNDRVLLLCFPCVIIFLSGAFLRSSESLSMHSMWLPVSLAVVVVLLQAGLFYRAYLPFYRGSSAIREIASKMKAYPGKTIYTFNIDQGLKAYEVKNEIINLWSARIKNFSPGALVLINSHDTSMQWEDMNPGINWETLIKEDKLSFLENLPEDWNLYEIKN
jgi:hypothetical protein